MNIFTKTDQNSGPVRTYALVVTLLLLLAGGLSVSYWKKAGSLAAESGAQASELGVLLAEKEKLEVHLDSLQMALNLVRSENENLEGKANSSDAIIAEKDAQIRKLKNQNSRQIKDLKAQVEGLKKTKTEYETILAMLRAENEQLKAENAQLKAENSGLRDNNTQLNAKVDGLAQQLADQIRKTQSAQFKASAFRVEVERRNDKLTAKAKKARAIAISFDLADVPEAYQGLQKIYLVIADENGKPIASANPAKVSVHAPTGEIPIIAQQTRAVNLAQTQRLAFSYKPEEKMRSGNYVAAVYCDHGLLGASSFRLQ